MSHVPTKSMAVTSYMERIDSLFNRTDGAKLLSNISPETQKRTENFDEKKRTDISTYFIPRKRKSTGDVLSSPVIKKQCPNDICQLIELCDDPFSFTLCAVCGESIPMFLLDEHMEFHVSITISD